MEKLRNRLFACGTAAFMLMSGLPLQTAQTAFAAEIAAAARGDVNGDGKKNGDDLDALTKLLGEHVETLFAEEQYVQYDITEDGLIDVRDRYALSQYLSGAAKELPVSPGGDLDDEVTLALNNTVCFPGDEFQVALSFVDWNKDIAAYDITIGFDTALVFKKAEFVSGEGQYVAGGRAVKLSGLYANDSLRRGDIAVLTFQAPADQEGDFKIQAEGANIFSSEYGIYLSHKPEVTVSVQPLYEPVALAAAGVGSKSVSLKWEMPFTEQPVTGYRIYRGGKLIGETTGTAYTDTKLTADTDYEYTVSAVTESGTETAQSQPLNVHTAAPKILSADFPADTVSDANSDLTVKLAQTAPLAEMKLDIKGPDGKTASETVKLDGEDLNTVSWHWDVSKLADGAYTLTVTVKDTDGTTASAEAAVSVLNNPLKPLTLKGEAGGRTAVLSWALAEEAGVTGYRVYRLKADGKTWEMIAEISGRDTLSYTDCALTAGTKYTYAVTSTDNCGQESAKSNSVTVTPAADKTAPEITIFKPASGLRVSGDLSVSVSAKDENGVKSVRCEISADSGKTWKTLCEAEGDSASWIVNTAEQKDGVYQLRAMAADADGNQSSGVNVISIAFDNTAPEQVKNIRIVSVSPNDAAIAWDNVADEDFDHFIAIVSDSAEIREHTINDTLGLTLNGLKADTRYTVTVYAVDTAGNAGVPSEPFRFVSNSDITPPTITSFGVSSEYASPNAALTVRVSASDTAGIRCRYLQYSQDKENWKTLTLYNLYDYENKRVDFTLSDNTLVAGELYLRAYAEDTFGNKGNPEEAQIHTLTVDAEVPSAPGKLTAVADQTANLLSWTASGSEDVTGYLIERAVGKEDGTYGVIASGISVLTFKDSDIVPDGEYYYRLYAVDRAGNRSAVVKSGLVKRTPDTEKPVIMECGLTTGDLIVCSAHRTIQIMATDNNRIQSIAAAYRCEGTAAWTALKTTETQENSIRTELIVRTELPESIMKESSVTLQVTATDAAGNQAVSEYIFVIDDRKAEIKNAAAKAGEKEITVSWTCPDTTGVSRFYVLRKIGAAGKEEPVAEIIPGKDTVYSAADTDLAVGGSYIYRIAAYMTNGNVVSVTLNAMTVQAVPHAALDYKPAQVVGKAYNYDASGSRNAEDITSVKINFGDGSTAEKKSVQNAVFTHTYEKAGTYAVTLTVTNASGMSDTITVSVTAAEPDIMSTVVATVTKMDGTPAAGATVYVDVGTDHQEKHETGADGTVQFDCTAGEHEFGVFGNGYLPVTKTVTLQANAKKDLAFSVAEDQLVEADFKVKRMTLEEVKAAGINVKDPQNCQMVQIDVDLSYTITSTVTDHIRVYYDRSSGGYTVSSGSGGSGGGGGGGGSSDYNYYVKSISHDVTTVVLMRVPVKAQFIKEFFKVDMIVMNNADAGFSLNNCTATLALPSGLSLVENASSSEPRVADLGTIPGKSNKTVSWIIRGDRNGDYNISADFSATLEPFNEPVTAHFTSEDPIHVYGQEAAKITVTFDPVISCKTLYAEVLVENKSSIDLNDLSTNIGKVIADTAGTDNDGTPLASVLQTRFTGKDGILKIIDDSKSISVLHPGEQFSVVYAIRGVLAERLPGFYRRVETDVKKSSTSGNVKVQVAHIKIANVNDPLYGLAFDPEKDFLFVVQNHKGKAIGGAEITLKKGGTIIASGTADDRGRLVVPRGDDTASYRVSISAEGYTDYYESFNFPSRKSVYMETFMMTGDYGEEFDLSYCSYYDDNVRHINILNKTHLVNRTANVPFWLTATSTIKAVTFAIVQNNRVIESQTVNGEHVQFTDLKPQRFSAEEPVYLRITTSENDVFETQIGLKFVDVPSDPSDDSRVQDIADKIRDTFADNFTVSVPAPLVMQNKFGDYLNLTIMIPNLNSEDMSSPFNANVTVDGDSMSIGLSFSVSKDFKIGIVGVEFGLEISVTGTIDMENNTASVEVKVTGSLTGSVSTPEFRPPAFPLIFAKFTFSAGGSLSVTVTYTHDFTPGAEEQNSLDISLDASFTIGVTIAAGLGSESILAVEAYGTPSFTVEGRIVPDPAITSVALGISAGFRVVALDNTLEDWEIYNGTLQFYPRTSSRPRIVLPDGQMLDEAVKNPENYSMMKAADLPAAGAWNGQLGDGLTELQSGISAGSAPVLVTDGTNVLLVWVLRDAARGANNASYLVFSRYDAETKTWSEPATVDDNTNADTAPVLFAGADGIRIAYMESAKVYEEGESPELTDFAKQFVFRTAKYDAESGKFTDFRTINANEDGGFAAMPEFAQAADGTTYLFWTKNANGQIFGADDSNMILCAKETEDGWDTPTVLAEKLPEITGLTAGNDAAGNPVCAYVTSAADEDGAIVNTLYTADLSGKVTALASGDIAAPQFAEIPGKGASGLIWYQNGGLSASADLAKAEVLCGEQSGVTERFAVAGDRVLFLRNTENRAEVFSIRYDAEAGGFTAPVSIESGENLYYETLSVAQSGDDTLYAMRRTEATFSEEGALNTASALTGGILGETADIRISEPEYSCADVQPGQALPMQVTVFNDGTAAADEFTLRILDAAGSELASDTQKQMIASGASGTVSFAPVLPAELTPAVYTVSVTAGESDRTPDNNKAELDLDRTDLAIETDITYIGNTTRVAIFAKNQSNVPAAAVIRIQPASAEEETLTLFTDEIAPHTAAYWQLDSADMLGDIYRDFVNITVESDKADADTSNNSACVIVSKSGMDPYAAGDVNLDGAVGLEDAVLALKCYTRRVAELDNLGFSNTQQRCADIDKDGIVDVTDAMVILRYYVNCVAETISCSFTEYLAQQQNGGAKHEPE